MHSQTGVCVRACVGVSLSVSSPLPLSGRLFRIKLVMSTCPLKRPFFPFFDLASDVGVSSTFQTAVDSKTFLGEIFHQREVFSLQEHVSFFFTRSKSYICHVFFVCSSIAP